MKAIPTRYNGVQFRSRLEARWACFFDLMGWNWQYEPFDLNGWIPDFTISGADCRTLVEVKPIYEYDDVAKTAIAKAHAALGREHGMMGPQNSLLLLGYTWPTQSGLGGNSDALSFGWIDGWFESSDLAIFVAQRNSLRRIGFDHADLSSYSDFRCNRITGDDLSRPIHSPWESDPGLKEFVEDLWKQAGNTVQWKPPSVPVGSRYWVPGQGWMLSK